MMRAFRNDVGEKYASGRLLQLYIGLVLYGVSTALFVHANLGADPWDVFHLGVAKQLGISFLVR